MKHATGDYINPTQAAEMLGIKRQQVLKYIKSGRLASIQYVKPYGGHNILPSDVEKLKRGK